MKSRTLVVKVLLFFFVAFSISCKSDDSCDEGSLNVDFPIKIKLISPSGDNLYNGSDFNPTLLKIKEFSQSNEEIPFFQIVENNENLITFQAFGINGVNFFYNENEIFYFGFNNVELQSIDCVSSVTNFNVIQSNGAIICDCNIQQPLEVTLNL